MKDTRQEGKTDAFTGLRSPGSAKFFLESFCDELNIAPPVRLEDSVHNEQDKINNSQDDNYFYDLSLQTVRI